MHKESADRCWPADPSEVVPIPAPRGRCEPLSRRAEPRQPQDLIRIYQKLMMIFFKCPSRVDRLFLARIDLKRLLIVALNDRSRADEDFSRSVRCDYMVSTDRWTTEGR